MSAKNRRTLGNTLIILGVSAWVPFLVLLAGGQDVPILPFVAAHLTGLLGGWWLRNSANREEGIEEVESTSIRRRKIASRILIYLGVLMWAPYIYQSRILEQETNIGPFLGLHLTGVLSGVALRLSIEWGRIRSRREQVD